MLNELSENYQELWDSLGRIAPSLLMGAIYFAACWLVGNIGRKLVRRRLADTSDDILTINFIGQLVFWSMIILGLILFMNQVGLTKAATGLLAGAGVSALILGFAFKDIGENFLAGFFLAFSHPFHIGNVIEVSDLQGTVKQMSFRNTHIRTFDGKDIYLPNAMLVKLPLINYTRDGLLRHNFIIGIDYDQRIGDALKIIKSCLENEKRIEHGTDTAPFLQIDEFASSTLNIKVFYWVNSFDFLGSIAELKTDVMLNIYRQLSESGINMPSNVLEVKMYPNSSPISIEIEDKV